MLRLNGLIGLVTDAAIAERLHRLEHQGRIEYIVLDGEDIARHRLRVRTDRGTECAIALARNERLANGAVLHLEDDRAIVVRLSEEAWLSLEPVDAAAALELGYFAGNMHWIVRFDGPTMRVALRGLEQDYLDRLAPLLRAGKVRRG
jgi:urease accessory protein